MPRFSLACFLLTAFLAACNSAPPAPNTQPLTATRPATATSRPTTRPAASMVYYLVDGLLVRTDTQGNGHKELTTKEMKILSFRVTPDGSKVVCLREPRNPSTTQAKNAAPPEIAILDRDGNLIKAVRNSGAAKDWLAFGPPTLLPGGNRVGFMAADRDSLREFGGGPVYSIITMSADGNDSRRIATSAMGGLGEWKKDYGTDVAGESHGDACLDASWSSDGKTILCTLGPIVKDLRYRLWTMDADGTNFRQIGLDGSALGSFSPAGKRIVYVKVDARGTEIMVASADGSHPRQVTHLGAILSSPRWLSDGTTIAFLKMRAEVVPVPVGTVYTIQSDGTRLRQISRDNEPALIDASDDASLQNLSGRQ